MAVRGGRVAPMTEADYRRHAALQPLHWLSSGWEFRAVHLHKKKRAKTKSDSIPRAVAIS